VERKRCLKMAALRRNFHFIHVLADVELRRLSHPGVGNYPMLPVNRKHVRVYRSHASAEDHGYMAGSPAERLSQVWELTLEAWHFNQGADPEEKMQRNVAVVFRKQR
jgi:hypothetical protein